MLDFQVRTATCPVNTDMYPLLQQFELVQSVSLPCKQIRPVYTLAHLLFHNIPWQHQQTVDFPIQPYLQKIVPYIQKILLVYSKEYLFLLIFVANNLDAV